MNTDYRAELERIIHAHDADEGMSVGRWTANLTDAINRARALLDQQEPQPEPEGPSEDDLTQLLFDSFRGPIEFICDAEEEAHLMIRSHVKFARAVLARWGRPTPQPPAAGEVAASLIELRSTVMSLGRMRMFVAVQRIERAADLLQRQHPQPVAVSERLPGPGEWVWHCYAGVRSWEHGIYDNRKFFIAYGPESHPATHWCPANALPAPEATDV